MRDDRTGGGIGGARLRRGDRREDGLARAGRELVVGVGEGGQREGAAERGRLEQAGGPLDVDGEAAGFGDGPDRVEEDAAGQARRLRLLPGRAVNISA